MITGSNIIGVLIFLLFAIVFLGLIKFPKTKKTPIVIAIVIIMVLIVYFSISNSYIFKQDERFF